MRSTMEFDVSETDVEKNDEITDPDGIGFVVSDADMDEKVDDAADLGSFGFIVSTHDEIVGQDSFYYNEGIVMGIARHSKKEMDFVIENLSQSESECSGYNAMFKSNDAEFLTSTVIDEPDLLQNNNQSKLTEILLKISAIATKVSSFVENIRNDLNELKEALIPEKKREMSSAHNEEKNAWSSDSPVRKNNIPFNENFDCDEDYSESAEDPEGQFSNGNDESDKSHVQLTKIGDVLDKSNVKSTIEPVPLNSVASTTLAEEFLCDKQKINETFAYESAMHATDGLESPRPHILNIQAPVCNRFNDEDDDAHEIPTETAVNVIKLPINSPDDYARNEELLEEDGFEAALIEHLAPFADEDETGYMNRSILTIFNESFFLNSVSWKKERDRINVKHSFLLCCWKESFGKKFEKNVDNAKFMEHFRRFKSAKRASAKAHLKRLNKAQALKM